MITDCPNCKTDRFLSGLHPTVVRCWWCEFEIDYESLKLSEPISYEPNFRNCRGCGKKICIQQLDESVCAQCHAQNEQVNEQYEAYIESQEID